MQTNNPLISVIMPAFNAEKFISDSILSVLAQTYSNWELIIVNDGSKDRTLNIISAFDDKRIKIINQVNSGVAKARNAGIEISNGEFITFLDSDDLWFANKLELQMNYMLKNPQISLSYTDYESFIGYDKFIKNRQFYPFKIDDLGDRLLVFNYIATLTVMVKIQIIKQVGGFNTNLFGPEDWELWIRISKIGEIGYLDKKLGMYREHEGGISKNRGKQLEEELKVLDMHILKSDKHTLKKAALWFYYLKLANFYCTKKDLIGVINSYKMVIALKPFKIQNFTYPLKRLFNL